jgi:hypothetical protein
MRTKLRACPSREEEQPAGLKNSQAMPTLPRHDESLPSLDHGVFGRTVAIDGGEEAPFEHAEYFVARGMAFPVIGVNRMVVVEVDHSKGAVVFDFPAPIKRLWNTRRSPVVTM